ncbi:MAG: hypothetical protein NT154_24700 [Verrucomicrobia bacterium]|nr:hypothetical protein [Verrucomicrobiota bacterium]
MRRWLFGLACFATLAGLFYAVENWRGKRAWERCRRELEAKGEVLDWNVYIPAPVPDEQNIFKAPKMTEWFVRESMFMAGNIGPSKPGNTNAPFSLAPHNDTKAGPVLVAEVDVVPSNGPLPAGKPDAVLQFDNPAAREQAAKLLRESTGPCAEGATGCGLVARPLDQINPAYLVLRADTVPSSKALDDFLSASFNHFKVEPAGTNRFRVLLKSRFYTAPEYLALSQSAVPDLDLLRQALKRPYARIGGDYQRPFERPIPNFVRLRTVAQLLSQRAQCYLLLGQSEAAWHELALVRDMCRLLEGSPPRKATMLVETMIDTAISGLYVMIIQDGLRLRAWREPELAAIQKQLLGINLLPALREAVNAELARFCRTVETSPPAELEKMLLFGDDSQRLWDKLKNPRFLLIKFAPRGWMYQNLRGAALRDLLFVGSLDISNTQILPRNADGIINQLQTASTRFSSYTFLWVAAAPNLVGASKTLARNQALVNNAFIACGLERYHLAHGEYPDTLEALIPQFAEQLPHDLIGGQPLKYRRTSDSQFILYSIGWNEKDDGGVPGKTTVEGDWVWQSQSQ